MRNERSDMQWRTWNLESGSCKSWLGGATSLLTLHSTSSTSSPPGEAIPLQRSSEPFAGFCQYAFPYGIGMANSSATQRCPCRFQSDFQVIRAWRWAKLMLHPQPKAWVPLFLKAKCIMSCCSAAFVIEMEESFPALRSHSIVDQLCPEHSQSIFHLIWGHIQDF